MSSSQPQIDNLDILTKANSLLTLTSPLSDDEDWMTSAQPRPSLNSSYEAGNSSVAESSPKILEPEKTKAGTSSRQSDGSKNESQVTQTNPTNLISFLWNCEPLVGKLVQITALISSDNSFEGQYSIGR